MAWGNGHSEDEGRETTGRFRIGEIRKANAKDNGLALVAIIVTIVGCLGVFALWVISEARAAGVSAKETTGKDLQRLEKKVDENKAEATSGIRAVGEDVRALYQYQVTRRRQPRLEVTPAEAAATPPALGGPP